MKAAESESDLAKRVIEWLESQHWEIFQEVQIETGGRCVDILARQGRIIWAIEVKKSLSIAVIEQACNWTRYAHFSSVAVPNAGYSRVRSFAYKIMTQNGIGVIEDCWDGVKQHLQPRLNRHACTDYFTKGLLEVHKTFASAGNSNSVRYTPFKGTAIALCKIAKEFPGISLRDAIKKIEHHYSKDSTAFSCLSRWIKEGKIKVRTEIVNKKTVLFSEEDG